MELNKFLELFKDLDPETQISTPELIFTGSDFRKINKTELGLELFKIKDKQTEIYKEKIIRQNSLFLAIIIILIIIIAIQLIMLRLL